MPVQITIENVPEDVHDALAVRAARYAWPVKTEKVEREVEIVLACYKRQIVGVFIPTHWHTADDGDSYFDGHEADAEIQDLYVGRDLSDDLRCYGGSVRYVI